MPSTGAPTSGNGSPAAGDRPRRGVIVLSLKEKYANAILGGGKTVELRRTTPRMGELPAAALLYAVSPVKALLGTCVVTDIQSGDLSALWAEHGPRTGVSSDEFERYFEGLESGAAILLSGAERLVPHVPLHEMRSLVEGFRPPQSFCYVDAQTGGLLTGGRTPAGLGAGALSGAPTSVGGSP